MEEKEEKFFRAVLKRPDNLESLDYDYDPAINLFFIDEFFESLKNKYNIEKLRKFTITRDNCVVFGIITNLSVTKKDLQKIPLTILPFRNCNSLPKK